MLKVAHVVEAFTGGVGTYMQNVLPALARRGCAVTLIYSPGREWAPATRVLCELADAGIALRPVLMRRGVSPKADFQALWKVWKAVEHGRFDIVHTHASKAGFVGRLAARLAGVGAVVHTPHCFAFLRCGGGTKKALYLAGERLLGRLSHALIAVSREECRLASRLHILPRTRCRFVNNGLEDWPAADGPQAPRRHDPGTGKWATEPDQFVVVTVCRLVRYKGVFMFLEAAELSRTPRGVFMVAGEGECRGEIENWISRRGQGDRIRLLGHVHDIDALYRRADLMVLCSRAEGQPYVLLEAMRAKCAILATDVPGNAGLIDHGKTGCLVAGNARDVARTIDHLLAHPEIRAAHAAMAHAAFRDHHLLESQVSRLLGTYAEYMREGRTR